MKKVLALILTAAMLLSCMIVGISAVREYTVNVDVSTDKAATNSANFCGLRYNDPYFTDGYTFKIVMKSCTADFEGQMAENTGFCDGVPIINMVANTIGWNNGPSLSYTFADDTWYTIEYVVDGNTTIKVNGTEVGVLDGAMPGNLYGSFYRSYVTEISYIGADGTVALYEDFEDGEDPVFSTDVTTFETTTTSYENYNVTYSTYAAATNSANFCGLRYNDPYFTDGYTFKIVMKSCTADFEGQMAENTGFCDGVPIINMVANTIGWNNGPSLSYTFADDTWYTIEYVVDGNTTIKVNGAEVGVLDGAMPGNLYGSFYRSYVREVSYIGADGTVALYEDFTDGEDNVFSTDLTTFTEVGNKYDLGMKYWMFQEGNNYAPINVGSQDANFDVEMDICLDSADSNFGTSWLGLANSPRIATNYIGVGNSTLEYTFTPGTWYHVKWDANEGETDIYVDDAYVGTVAEVASLYEGNQAFWQWVLLSIDNLSVGTYFCDMENGLGDYQGMSMEYEFYGPGIETIFDKFDTTAPAAGDAILMENSWDGETGYIEMGSAFANLGTSYIIDFDLAIIPTNNSADGNYFELWTDWQSGGMKRFKFGTSFVGRDEDLKQIDTWGDATYNNFHQVTYEFANNRCTLYLDQVEVYSALCGNYAELANMIFMYWNASVIIDNFQIVNGETFELMFDQTDIPTGTGYGLGNDGIKTVNLDAENFCEANEHITGKSTMDYDSTCYSNGNWSTYCAVCGEKCADQEIALKDHVWAGYDINRKTDTGLVYTYCKNSGCVEQRYTELPKNYTGTLYQFYDMQDDMVLVVGDETATSASGLDGFNADGEQCWKVTEDGLEFLGHAVYDEFHGLESSQIPVNDWSVSFDFFLDESKHWTNEDGGVDYESFFLRCAGAQGYQLCAGWDRINNQLFIRRFDGTKTFKTLDYTFENLTTYNFKVSVKYEGYGYTHEDMDISAPWYAEIAIWINGEKVLAYGDTTGADQYSIYDIAFGSDYNGGCGWMDYPALSQFGTSYTIDNLAFGSADFEIVKVAGDIDGDGELTAADATMMRKYLAGIITLDEFVDASVADVNGDGAINAKDQLAIRIALAA